MQIVLFLVLVLLVLLIVVSKKDSLSKNTKITIMLTIAIFCTIIYFYESSTSKSAEKNREIVNTFRQGKILTCGEYKVDKNRFLYVSGTQTFVPQKSETSLEGVIVKVSTCKDN
ncbi:hypothetical protein [Sulfurospirillum arcachonense]|uniref:hypothetical protein n=1 Tax=Sulfurospirillum arcachonense TaxID=57666 RepID=UPI0004696AF0|nr:hypothetical protein [Sulfurospirillum arcachonense]